MIDYDLYKIKDIFARMFVIGIQNKINLYSFSSALERSEFVNCIEKDTYSELFNQPLEDIFYSITENKVEKDESYGIYNDAYWAGKCYFDLHTTLNKTFAYLFLKLPIDKMLDLYPVYHEMDFSSLVEYFKQIEEETTILKTLCEEKKVTLTEVSKKTGININTLRKYYRSDVSLYKAEFQNIAKIVEYFDTTFLLFIN